MFWPIVLFIIGLLLLMKGGDWFVDGATGLAHRFRLPEVIVGATVVSIGTTLPEVMVSLSGAIAGQGAMAYGNAIGSVICNTALISAITIAVRPGPVDTKSMKTPVAFFFLAAVIYALAAYVSGYFYAWIGFILLSIFAVYMFLTIRSGLLQAKEATSVPLSEDPPVTFEHNDPELHDDIPDELPPKYPLYKDLLLLVVGAVMIAFGADFLVDNGTIIAKAMGVPETVIALTFVALGTSLPELVTAITSLVKGHGALSLGNVIGANIFNLVLVSGASIAIAPFPVPLGNTLFGINSSLVLDIPLMFLVMGMLTIPTMLSRKLSRWQGITMLCLYAGFCALQFVL